MPQLMKEGRWQDFYDGLTPRCKCIVLGGLWSLDTFHTLERGSLAFATSGQNKSSGGYR